MSIRSRRRVHGAIEHNLIQRPELAQRLRRAVGVRQAHLAPTLSEGIQPVIIVDDVSSRYRDEPEQQIRRGSGHIEIQGDSVNKFIVALFNPTNPRPVVCRIYRTIMSSLAVPAGVTRVSTAWQITQGGTAFAFDTFGNQEQFMHPRSPGETGAVSPLRAVVASKVTPGVSSIPSGKMGIATMNVPFATPWIVDWPGVILRDDMFWEFELQDDGAVGDDRMTTNHSMSIVFEWTEEPEGL